MLPNEFTLVVMRAARSAVLLAIFAVLTSPIAATAQPVTGTNVAGSDQTYILGPADVIEVSIPGRTDFTTRGRIGENGSIGLPYLGSVAAAGRNPGQLANEIGRALQAGGYFAKPTVNVQVVSYASKYVTVLGQVANPGLVPIDRGYRVSEIIARVGGVKDGGADYVILRPEKGAERHLALDTLATGDSSEDPYVSPGDKIYSPKAELFYVSGQVVTPGTFPLVPDMTLRMAIARAGGVNAEGSLGKVVVTRHGKKLRQRQRDLDAKAQAGDIIVVGERLF